MNNATFKTIFGSIAVLLALTCWLFAGAARAEGPSFDCGKVEAGSIEEMVCKDKGLAALDRKLAEVYAAASKKAVNEHPPRSQGRAARLDQGAKRLLEER